jgi:hypothetical protein
MKGLLLHCGASATTREAIVATPTPPPTDTHFPIPHGELLRSVEEYLSESGYEVVEQAHGLGNYGARYFGLLRVRRPQRAWDTLDTPVGTIPFGVDTPDLARGEVVGLRNAHDKRYSASVALGDYVFVCDNLSFAGEVVIGRKHTRFIRRDLDGIIRRAVGELGEFRQRQETRRDAYRQTELSTRDAYALTVDALKAGAIGQQRFRRVIREWDEPSHEEFAQERNVWRLYNAVTEAFKPRVLADGSFARGAGLNALADNVKASRALHGVLDGHCGIALN